MPDPLLDQLNDRQRQAVVSLGGVLVLAGAGTGKTRVLTSRAAWLLRQNIAEESAILAVTFTNKAAREMRQRISAFHTSRRLMLGTFHGVCHRILRTHAENAGWNKNFQIMDMQDQLSFIKRLLRNMNIDEKEYPAREVRGYINAAKESGWRAHSAPVQNARAKAMADIYAIYEKTAKNEQKADFSELMLGVMELLQKDEHLRTHYAGRFRHILIDEFQDTNRLQFDWLKLLDSGDNCFFAVGDDDQSIYRFRGAEPENMNRFLREFRADEIIRLEKNYRSTANILNAANHLIAVNKNRLGKNLNTDEGAGATITVCAADNDEEEAAAVTRDIEQRLGEGVNADDIVVLYRTNAQSRLLELRLRALGVPYRIYGGTRFFDRMEIKHALAYMRLAAGDDKDSLLRVINTPPRGIGKRSLENLTTAANGVFSALLDSEQPKIAAFAALLRELREGRNNLTLGGLARLAVEKSGLATYYEARESEKERAENLREFVNAATQFEKTETDDDMLLRFLSDAALDSGEAIGETDGAVNLSTVHAAKGLEFKTTFIVGLEDGLFPHDNAVLSGDPNDVEEERRLMYVAITRAKRELSLHFARRRMSYGKLSAYPPSRFLDELPKKCLSGDDWRAASPPVTVESHAARRFNGAVVQRKVVGGFCTGDTVSHPKYGLGIIIKLQGRGIDAQAEIAFKKNRHNKNLQNRLGAITKNR